MHLTIDFETRSRCDLKKSGAWKYAADPSTESMCLSVKVNAEPSRIWIPELWENKFIAAGREFPLPRIGWLDIIDRVDDAETIEAHNTGFERAIWYHVHHLRGGWPDLPLAKMRCSAARAAMCGLPRDLAGAGRVLGLSTQKDWEGHQLMMKFRKPQKRTSKGVVTESWHEDLDDYIKLCRYCLTDTDAEHDLSRALPPLPEKELALWRLDQRMNQRGVHVDGGAVRAFIGEIAKEEASLFAEFQSLVQGRLKSPKQAAAFRALLLEDYGLDLPDLQKDTIANAISDVEEEIGSLAEETET